MNKIIERDRRARFAGIALVLTAVWFLPWLFAHTDTSKLWVSLPFLAATLTVAAASLISVVNRWQRAVPVRRPVPAGQEPRVAVIIPTLGEPLELLEATVRSVLEQDWPDERLWIVVSDDGHDERVQDAGQQAGAGPSEGNAALSLPATTGRPAPPRRGQGRQPQFGTRMRPARHPVRRDTRCRRPRRRPPLPARDAWASCSPLTNVAFVQTRKAGQVAEHDPFDNHQPHFFQCAMLSRYAANAVFPCGSGVVWRRKALHEIGDFPTWNLVEDLQSGLEALRLGWEGCYLPILGAYAQHSPEDLPNFVKQRGTWALDTVRLALWAPKRGLTIRQRLQFYELALFYMQGPATLVFLLAPVLGFMFHLYPVVTTTNALRAAFLAVRSGPRDVSGARAPAHVPRAAMARTTRVGGPVLRVCPRMPARHRQRANTQAALRGDAQAQPPHLALASDRPAAWWYSLSCSARWRGRWRIGPACSTASTSAPPTGRACTACCCSASSS